MNYAHCVFYSLKFWGEETPQGTTSSVFRVCQMREAVVERKQAALKEFVVWITYPTSRMSLPSFGTLSGF